MKQKIGIVTLAAGHSLMVGNASDTTKFRVDTDITGMGLYNLSSDGYAAELQADPVPASEEFIYPVYRGLSETIVRKTHDPIDFSQPGVLKESRNKMLGQTVYKNHFAYVGNEVGSVKKVTWEEGYTAKNGILVPAGFNLMFQIDAKSNPQLARGIQMDPPSIHSNSVTVNFAWEQSHPKMDYRDFRYNVGKLGEDGKLIRRIVTAINAYYETSLVSHGADPFAQKIGSDGKIVNPGLAASRDSFSAEIPGTTGFHFFSFKDHESFSATDTTPLDENATIPAPTINNKDNNENKSDMKFSKNIALAMAVLIGYKFDEATAGLSEEEFDKADLSSFSEALGNSLEGLQALGTLAVDKANLSTKVTELEAQLVTAKAEGKDPELEKLGNKYKASLLSNVLALHATVHGEQPNEELSGIYAEANPAALEIFQKQLETNLSDKFPLCCQECGSNDVSRNSADASGEGNKTETKKKANINLAKVHDSLLSSMNGY